LGALMIQVGLDGAFASVCCCDSHAGILTTHYGFSIVKCSKVAKKEKTPTSTLCVFAVNFPSVI
jgi:hypothetical protein